MRDLLRLAALAIAIVGTSNIGFAAPDSEGATRQKAVLVTGASTGIGRKITEVLAGKGYFVYAGARKQNDLDDLNSIPNVQSIRLDVTVQEEIDAAVESIRNGGRGLYGLVNNAGVACCGPLIETDVDDIKWMFDVNVFGVFRVTRAFAPLIIESEGRIVTIGSIAGIGTGLGLGPYSMSKYAIEAFADALAVEMERLDVKVSVIEPGNYRTNIAKSDRERQGALTEAQKSSPYADFYKSRSEYPVDLRQWPEPDDVADAAIHALFDEQPKHRYMVVPNLEQATWTIDTSIRKAVQLNDAQEYSFSRAELIEMLDQALNASEE